MNKTKIEYLTHSWNPLAMRCTPVSEGCANCWHIKLANRLAANPSQSNEARAAYAGDVPPFLKEDELLAPLRRKKPARIGVQFMGDLFHEGVPFDYIDRVFAVMAQCPQHTFVVLTKRARRMHDYFHKADYGEFWFNNSIVNERSREDAIYDQFLETVDDGADWEWPLPNVWGMVTTENQRVADERIRRLLDCPFVVHGVSAEPLLEFIDVEKYFYPPNLCTCPGDECTCGRWNEYGPSLDWVVAGGEDTRPMHPDWARKLRDDCRLAGVAYFFKQRGAWTWDFPEGDKAPSEWGIITREGRFTETVIDSKGIAVWRVGKKRAGRELDGREWDEYPSKGMIQK